VTGVARATAAQEIKNILTQLRAMPTLHPGEAFGGSQVRRELSVRLAKLHRDADMVAQGLYWLPGRAKTWKGCTAGCLTHRADGDKAHAAFPTLYGIPISVSLMADYLFEDQDADDAPAFHVNWISAIPVGADLRGVVPVLLAWTVREYLLPYVKSARARALLQRGLAVADALGQGKPSPEPVKELDALMRAQWRNEGDNATEDALWLLSNLAPLLPDLAAPDDEDYGFDFIPGSVPTVEMTQKFLELLAAAPIAGRR